MVGVATPRITATITDSALAQDAAAVAPRLGLTAEAALRHVRLQQASVAFTDAITARFAERLAGIAIDHHPAFRIVVRLTGTTPVAAERIIVAGAPVDIVYVVNAPANRTTMVAAIAAHQAAIRESLTTPPGLGIDQRSGEVVAVVGAADAEREGAAALRSRLAALVRVPVRLRIVDVPTADLADETIGGGMRMTGGRPGDPRRYLCTAGFVVTDGERDALATAAHCADELQVRDGAGEARAMPFLGQWGWGYRDVQLNLAAGPLAPVIHAGGLSRPIAEAQPRAAARAGDVVCHRGERTGYSCSQIELTDFAPAGDLCGGACLPNWTTVAGPGCRGGDSGGPVFLGNVAHGILKGGSYRADSSCAFYFYMSTDYLPPGWRLRTMADPPR